MRGGRVGNLFGSVHSSDQNQNGLPFMLAKKPVFPQLRSCLAASSCTWFRVT